MRGLHLWKGRRLERGFVVRELNAEMQKQGYLTVAGRVNATFFIKKYDDLKGQKYRIEKSLER